MTLIEFKEFNKEQGYHYFEPDTMRFFDSKIEQWDSTDYFVTSEKTGFESTNRKYSIRKANFETGNVKTIGTFFQYDTIDEAELELDELVNKERS